ncbi:MAG TPA: VWA domain-containing protein [Acidimicrobiales bacterium]|jgi:hypothetical protein|nr:VWA domain-containing protein [Acidimicrobiales bacterium]
MLELLGAFVGELRAAGIPVSTTEHLDAARALVAVDLMEREVVKASLAATMVKDDTHYAAFDLAFEIFFSTVPKGALEGLDDDGDGVAAASEGQAGEGQAGEGGGAGGEVSAEELAEMLFRALRDGDQSALSDAARLAVSRFAGVEPGRPVGGTYYLYRTLRNLDLDALRARLMSAEGPVTAGSLAERLARDDAEGRIEQLKRAVQAEIRRRLVEDRGAVALARSVRRPLPEDLDVMHATRDELAAMHRALVPLSRKLAERLARKRRKGHRGALDLRRTVRASMSTGGVPITPVFKPPRPAKPEIFVIADVSGSVASFARFTLLLVHAISSQFRKVRSFVFVDGLDEATRFFEETQDPHEAVMRINTEADVIYVDGHSDYGRALTTFHERYATDVSRRASVLVLGDARNNYHAAQAWVLDDLRQRARAVYWLNPEPQGYWNSGDSIVATYAPHCDAVVECRTLRQLEKFVGTLA